MLLWGDLGEVWKGLQLSLPLLGAPGQAHTAVHGDRRVQNTPRTSKSSCHWRGHPGNRRCQGGSSSGTGAPVPGEPIRGMEGVLETQCRGNSPAVGRACGSALLPSPCPSSLPWSCDCPGSPGPGGQGRPGTSPAGSGGTAASWGRVLEGDPFRGKHCLQWHCRFCPSVRLSLTRALCSHPGREKAPSSPQRELSCPCPGQGSSEQLKFCRSQQKLWEELKYAASTDFPCGCIAIRLTH